MVLMRTSIDDGCTNEIVERLDDDAPFGDLLAQCSVGKNHGPTLTSVPPSRV